MKFEKYFEYRNVNPEMYENFKLPLWIKKELNDRNARILDYGCGFGQYLKALREEGYFNIYGVDVEESAIEYCIKKKLNVKKINPDGPANPYDFKFDYVICLHVLEHIPKDGMIDTLVRIRNDFLSEGGVLLVAVPNAQSNTNSYWAYEDFTHTTLFTSGSIFYILKAAGFKKIEFLDIDCTIGSSMFKSLLRKLLLRIYRLNKEFWNRVTCSSYHKPSPVIFSYEIKVKAW